ncbi:MAG: TonB C-terminal domain-containing protein [Deltaproteobacteria bacterium]|nr:TonB C-terminal domain-containing protein [Deltaproteobacteria bacterium]
MSAAQSGGAVLSARGGVLGTDHRPGEVLLALGLALAVQAGAALALQAARLDAQADAREIDPGIAVPIQVRPVVDLDSPLLKLGGKKVRFKLPDRWLRQEPVQRVERRAFASTTAEDAPDAAPPRELALAEAGAEPPGPDAALAKQVDTEMVGNPDAAPANVDTEGHPDGVPEGTETDPLKARAVSLYRARLIAWFSSRFRVSGSGMSQEELQKYKVGAVVSIDRSRMVVGYSISPSGNSVFDSAARAALESAKGQQLPPPPENYPDAVQNTISLTFVCRASTCD